MKITTAAKPPAWLFPNLGDIRLTREFQWAKRAVIIQFLIGGVVLMMYWKTIPPSIPLWYSRPWGEDRLASPYFLILPLLSAGLIYFINLTIISKVSKDHPMFARILLLTSVATSLIAVMIVTRVVLLVS